MRRANSGWPAMAAHGMSAWLILSDDVSLPQHQCGRVAFVKCLVGADRVAANGWLVGLVGSGRPRGQVKRGRRRSWRSNRCLLARRPIWRHRGQGSAAARVNEAGPATAANGWPGVDGGCGPDTVSPVLLAAKHRQLALACQG